MNRAYEVDFEVFGICGGIKLYAYQIALGLSVRWWPAVRIRGYIGPIEFWAYDHERKEVTRFQITVSRFTYSECSSIQAS